MNPVGVPALYDQDDVFNDFVAHLRQWLHNGYGKRPPRHSPLSLSERELDRAWRFAFMRN